jgi:hypothetical protein
MVNTPVGHGIFFLLVHTNEGDGMVRTQVVHVIVANSYQGRGWHGSHPDSPCIVASSYKGRVTIAWHGSYQGRTWHCC